MGLEAYNSVMGPWRRGETSTSDLWWLTVFKRGSLDDSDAQGPVCAHISVPQTHELIQTPFPFHLSPPCLFALAWLPRTQLSWPPIWNPTSRMECSLAASRSMALATFSFFLSVLFFSLQTSFFLNWSIFLFRNRRNQRYCLVAFLRSHRFCLL